MAKKLKAIICVIIAFSLILPLSLNYVFSNENEDISFDYYNDLNKIYSEYNDFESIDKTEPYALSRVIVNGWNKKTYGAAAYAYDEKNDFAVLQYSSPKEAQAAQLKMQKDGLLAEEDGVAVLDSSEKCTLSPEYSSKLGTPDFLNGYNMPRDDVIVAVIDTGVMYDHSAIADRFYSTGTDLSGDSMADAYYNTAETGDYFGHGTFICGVIADNTPDNVKLLPVKVVEFNSSETSSSAIISGINYAVEQGAKVINISLGTYSSQTSFQRAVNNAVSNGVCICASTGNNGEELDYRFPATLDNVFAVSALDESCTNIASYSNYGECVDFCAPGYRVYSTYPSGGESSFRSWSGTSFSSPYVAALCADIKSLDSALSSDEVYQTLCDFALDLGESGHDNYFGNGMPQIGNMVYTDNQSYEFRIPQGVLNITDSRDYTESTQPWRRFASKLTNVNLLGINTVGDYMLYNVSNAEIYLSESHFTSIGDYAFYGCSGIQKMYFDTDIEKIGYKAFGGIDGFKIFGYRNTPAETYALSEGITFVKLGCKHNYYYEVFEPEGESPGYTVYTCSVCGDSYVGDYIQSEVLISGECGESMTFTLYDTGKLIIGGSGEMYDYTESRAPWYGYKDSITIVDIKADVQSVSPFAFYGCTNAVKLYVSNNNAEFSTDGVSLFNKTKTELVLTFARGTYTLPDSVSSLSSIAFIAAENIALTSNNTITVESSVIYDADGNILAVLPAFRERRLVLNEPVSINDYAFSLCSYPERVESEVNGVMPGDYSLGYTYNGEFVKHGLTVKASAESGLGVYAIQNGFELESGIGKCGDELTYTYDETLGKLVISGLGAMTEYASAAEIPWYSVMSSITDVEIADTVTALSPYAFYGASSLISLTMPLSMQAPADETVWEGCTAIETLSLTYGSGIMDDYEDENGTPIYQYSPWYVARSNITQLTVDSRVRYIGSYAFRSNPALRSLTLDCIEELGSEALLGCSKLKDFTINTKDAVLPDYSILSYKTSQYKIYKGFYVKGYNDSTVKDYCDRLSAGFISLGCGHSRNQVLISSVTDSTGITNTYRCADCGEEISEFLEYPILRGTLCSTNGQAIAGAALTYGESTVISGSEGEFTFYGASSESGELTVTVNGCELLCDSVELTENETAVEIYVRYADYVSDGVINAKDYAFALKNGYNDKLLFDYGKIESTDNRIVGE